MQLNSGRPPCWSLMPSRCRKGNWPKGCVRQHGRVFSWLTQAVAIKKIKVGAMKDGLDMTALREVKFLQELHHPNIISVSGLI